MDLFREIHIAYTERGPFQKVSVHGRNTFHTVWAISESESLLGILKVFLECVHLLWATLISPTSELLDTKTTSGTVLLGTVIPSFTYVFFPFPSPQVNSVSGGWKPSFNFLLRWVAFPCLLPWHQAEWVSSPGTNSLVVRWKGMCGIRRATFCLNQKTCFGIREGEWGAGSWKEDFRKEILLIVISAKQKLVYFCSFPLSITLDDNFFFCYYF